MLDKLQVVGSEQMLYGYKAGKRVVSYPVSTGKTGMGEVNGSGMTPRGEHVIRAKIGGGLPANTVFIRRRPTGEIYTPELALSFPDRDWILTRILWLSGCERGKNRLGECDTMRRYIYIHGTPETTALGTPGSKGCIRMHNEALMDIFDRVSVGIPLTIIE